MALKEYSTDKVLHSYKIVRITTSILKKDQNGFSRTGSIAFFYFTHSSSCQNLASTFEDVPEIPTPHAHLLLHYFSWCGPCGCQGHAACAQSQSGNFSHHPVRRPVATCLCEGTAVTSFDSETDHFLAVISVNLLNICSVLKMQHLVVKMLGCWKF